MKSGRPASGTASGGGVASFRDPDGSVRVFGDRVLRRVAPHAVGRLRAILASPVVGRLVADGSLIQSRWLNESEKTAVLAKRDFPDASPADDFLEHPKVPMATYPYEWSPGMLLEAGKLTLDIAQALQAEGLGLKDATPYNVLFLGSKPVFVDIASIEQRFDDDPTWLPYAQMQRTFVLPLLVNRYCGVSLKQAFLGQRDGLEPDAVYDLLGLGRKLSPAFFFTVTLPTRFARRAATEPGIYKRRSETPEKASFILRSTLNLLRRQLLGAAPASRSSTWSDYMETKSYEDEDFKTKERFVREALAQSGATRVLDIGSNTGHFSALAAEKGASVVAIDSDPVCVDRTFARARERSLRILPVVADISRPSPALGWRNQEQASLVDRLERGFDLVLMLAVIHHLLVTERAPLEAILDLASDFSESHVVVEYVGPQDPMFRKIARGRDDLFSHVTPDWFEAACRARFEIQAKAPLSKGDRCLYLLRRR